MSNEYSFARCYRLTESADFRRVFSDNQRWSDKYWTVLVSPNQTDVARLGLAVAKKRVKRAVDRNSLKRLIRESFRRHRPDMACLDIIVMPRMNCRGLETEILEASLGRLWKKIISRYED